MVINSYLKSWFYYILITSGILLFTNCKKTETDTGTLQLLSVKANDINLNLVDFASNEKIELSSEFQLKFTALIDTGTVKNNINIQANNQSIPINIAVSSDLRTVIISTNTVLTTNTVYTIAINKNLKGLSGQIFDGANIQFKTILENLTILSIKIDNAEHISTARPQNIELNPTIQITFSSALNPASLSTQSLRIVNAFGASNQVNYQYNNTNNTITVTSQNTLQHLTRHELFISSEIAGLNGEPFTSRSFKFYTRPDSTPKFDVISDEELLTKVQQATFKYFWDFAHPASGLSRERNSSGDLVTIGGSGFGIMAILVGIERGFITRDAGVERLQKITDFLETADRFHGAWGHWYNGNTGKINPFSTNDNGGDLVETSFLAQGLITARQYLDKNNTTENHLIDKINTLLNGIEWSWYNHDNQNMLSWHWSPTVAWAIGMHIRGYNEALISYVMAASSTTHAIEPIVYNTGWTGTSYFKNGKYFYNYLLPLGFDYGGPLFFTHYSFLGLDPRNLSDQHANYWQQNVNHTLINRQYCITNPKKFVAYSPDCWGLTASDDNTGYGVHEPTRDIGVISPTAALSSFPYTPEESMKVLKFLYYVLGDRVWGEYGFYDAFNITEGWWGKSYLAIDQGPIIIMIENHRTALLWNLFMSAPEVQQGLTRLGFSY